MQKIFIVGNPNTGKSTLFNKITKSDEHTGNWHGVTVEVKSKILTLDSGEFEIFDLPGLYSLNTYSFEEIVAKNTLLDNLGAKVIYILDANTIERNLYLLMQLKECGFHIKIVVNNYDYFLKHGGSIDIKKLSKYLCIPCMIFDAKKDKFDKRLLQFENSNFEIEDKIKSINNFDKNIKNHTVYSKDEFSNNTSYNYKNKFADENIFANNPENIYVQINEICEKCVTKKHNYVYGKSKKDKFILNPVFFFITFIVGMFLCLFTIFFLLGPKLSSGITFVLNSLIKFPLLSALKKITSNRFLLSLFDEGIMSACLAVCSFLPQVCLLYILLSVLENSGLISRFAFMLDDFLSKLGLNGKCVYTLLMGFGCNTSATVTAKNMPDKNSKIKTVMITPFMSCTAKLPIYSVILSAVLGSSNVWVIAGLYFLGIAVAILITILLEKTILPSHNSNFLIEFPPLKLPDIKDVVKTTAKSSKQFLSKVFGIIVSMSVVVWILSNVSFSFKYTGEYESSILYLLSGKFNVLFRPLGFSSQAIVCTLIVGLVAKELIVSTMMIFNHKTSLADLIYSITLPTSLICFNFASGMSFLVFVLLYAPCVSNFAVMIKEIGLRYSLVSVACQFGVAYILAFITYNLFSVNILNVVVGLLCFGVVLLVVKYKKAKGIKICCCDCQRCKIK